MGVKENNDNNQDDTENQEEQETDNQDDDEAQTDDSQTTDTPDVSELDLETLQEENPQVAKMTKNFEKLESQVDELQEKLQEKEEQEKKEEGEFQDLYQETKTELEQAQSTLEEKNDILTKYSNTVSELLDTHLEQIPDNKHSLIPDDYSDRQKLEYISNNQDQLGISIANTGNAVEENETDPSQSEAEKKRARFNELQEKYEDSDEELTRPEQEEFTNLGREIKRMT